MSAMKLDTLALAKGLEEAGALKITIWLGSLLVVGVIALATSIKL